uniref:clp protease proteolytic subunit n=1 Tax=Euphorbia schlechtendalii TaxID=216487 RepID=UPI0020007C19|nr:clp protease proteolytic subunit [Euphorbia schlechtendalii]UNS16267.1 clp protease proteolytic subunit [Euphorbia schlechtendalii]
MPIGVPKVPFEYSEDEEADWVDVYNRLYQQRFLFLGQEVQSEIANQIMGLMVYLSIESGTTDLYLFINCPGGWVVPGIGIFDTMQFVRPDVHTVCLGLAASTGSFILVGGTLNKRAAFPHARVMIHQPLASFYESSLDDFFMDSDELVELRELVTDTYLKKTRKPLWLITPALERDVFFSASEAQLHGIIDRIGLFDLPTK